MALLVEMGWGGLVQYPETITWTDISQYVSTARGVSISRGAADELSETQPGTAVLTLDNADGRFTPGNSSSPYYPFVRRNAPIRIAVAHVPTRSGAAPYPLAQLGDDFDDDRVDPVLWPNSYGGVTERGGVVRIPVSTAGDAGLQSVRQWTLKGSRLTAKLVTVPKAGGSSNVAASMWVNSTTAGTRIGWRYDALTGLLAASNQTAYFDGTPTTLTYSPIDHAWLRVRETAGTVYWETSRDGFGWTVRRTLTAPAWVSSQTHAVEFPATRTGGTNDFIEWDLVGAIVKPRFWGMVNEFPIEWEGLSSRVTVTCTDLFKRLNRLPVLRSMAAEEVLASGPLAFYPLTEPSDSTSAGDLSGIGAGSLTIQQAGTGGTLTMAAAPGPPATEDQVPLFTPSSATAGKWLQANMGDDVQQQLNGGRPVLECWFQTTTAGRAIMALASPDLQYVHVLSLSGSGQLQIEWTDTGGTLSTAPIPFTSGLADGQWHHVVFGQYSKFVFLDGALAMTGVSVPYGTDQRTLHIGGYRGTRLWSGSIAYVALYGVAQAAESRLASHYRAGATGYAGESAAERIQRLARYAGVDSVTILGGTFDPIASQASGGTQVVARMREVESTESAKLYAERDYFGLAFQSRDLRYNPDPSSEVFTVTYADLEPGTSIADDDQKMVNSLQASRPGGATQRVTAPSSITAFGLYEPQSLDILKTNDNSVLDAAYWVVSRYANPGPELREVAIEAYTMPNYLDILDADISSYFTVYGLPSQAPASSMRVTVEGYTETIRERSHVIQFHTSASFNDSVWVLDDPVYSRLDSTSRLAY
ncbi:LamG-like jellyroll fold domain-containing protein [Streptomyces sp. NPDC088353]|uniref:LamG-like jellyroll fold domain-containing protein n=1 Tax=Streptomyces sp. NPDC088353 TaxID=3365855 RepID=UPI00380D8A1E